MVAAFTASSKIGEAMQKENQKISDAGTSDTEAKKPDEPETPEFGEFEDE